MCPHDIVVTFVVPQDVERVALTLARGDIPSVTAGPPTGTGTGTLTHQSPASRRSSRTGPPAFILPSRAYSVRVCECVGVCWRACVVMLQHDMN